MDELLGFEVRPIQGVVVAVGEEVTFKEEDGKLLALNEDGEAFGVVPNRFAKSLHELTESGQGISAFVQSRSGGVPFIIVSRAKVTAVADSGAVKPELEEKSGEEKPNEEKPEQAVAANEAARDASVPVPPEEVSERQTDKAEQASETPELPRDADEQNAPEPETLPPQSSSGQTKKSKKISQDTAGLIFCCAFCVILVIVIAAWPCDHEWAEATCTEPATCIKCGETEGSALGHDWQEATCTEPKTCSRCGETRGDVSHTWVDATCTEPKTCSVCGLTDGEALGHNWKEATCTEPATCSRCGETDGEALGHDWQEATCTEPATCSRCGETDGEALGHTVEDWTVDVEATCTSEGSKSGTCTACGETVTEIIEMTDHTEGEWSLTDTAGYNVLRCTVCGEIIEKEETSRIISALQGYGMFDEVTISGSGDDVIELPASGVPMIIEITYSGNSNFIIWTLDSSGDQVDLLVNTIGSYSGTVTSWTDYEDTALLSITASGSWSITFKPMCLMDELVSGETYSNDDVRYIATDDLLTLDVTYSGDGNFIIWGIGFDDVDLLVNEIDYYDGTVVWSEPQSFLIVTADDGDWTVTW